VVLECLVGNEFEKCRSPLLEVGIHLNIYAPREHVPKVERKICTVKDQIRGLLTMLPFQKIPTITITHAAMFSVM
jgi:hypothetical protein